MQGFKAYQITKKCSFFHYIFITSSGKVVFLRPQISIVCFGLVFQALVPFLIEKQQFSLIEF